MDNLYRPLKGLNTPPKGSHPVGDGRHAAPSHALWNIWLSVPSAKISRRLLPQATTAGGLANTPPNGSHPVTDGRQAPSHALWNIWLSVPRAKMSRRLLPQATTAG